MSETRIVSPSPSSSSAPIPIALLIAAVLAVARLGDTDVERVAGRAGPPLLEPRGEQPIGLDRHLRVARLHAEDDVAVVLVLADVEELERALDHAARRVAVAVQDAVGERAVVGADAQRAAELVAAPHERAEALGGALHLLGVLGVAVLAHLELLLVGVVARVDPDLLDVLGRDQRRARREVDVGDQRHAHAAPAQLARGSRARFSASLRDGAVMRTISQPAAASRSTWSAVPRVSSVSVVVIDCTRIGLVAADRDVADAHDRASARRRGANGLAV